MQDWRDDISIEASNGWFFAILLSLAVPWIFLPDDKALGGCALMFALWAGLGLWQLRRQHQVFKRWLAQEDDATLHAVASNRRMGSIRQRAARVELARRQAALGPQTA